MKGLASKERSPLGGLGRDRFFVGDTGDVRLRLSVVGFFSSLLGLPSPSGPVELATGVGRATDIEMAPRSNDDLRTETSGELSCGGVRVPIKSENLTGDARDAAGLASMIVLRLGIGEFRRKAGEGGPFWSTEDEGVKGEGI